VIGWWMVKSGLSEDATVSQYRLAVHLGTALVIFSLLVWTGLDLFYRPVDDHVAILWEAFY